MDKSRLNYTGNESKRVGLGHGQNRASSSKPLYSSYAGVPTKRQPFTIHPEWVSENFCVQPISIKKRMNDTAAATPAEVEARRCKSAPPRTRNPITWENPDINELCVRDINISLRAGRGRSKKRPKSEVMDSIGTNGLEEKPKGAKFNIKSTFFATTNSPRKQYFTIHPEWQSESGVVRKQVATYVQSSMTIPSRRCKSAPPPRTRNPITWTNADRPDRR